MEFFCSFCGRQYRKPADPTMIAEYEFIRGRRPEGQTRRRVKGVKVMCRADCGAVFQWPERPVRSHGPKRAL